RKKSLHHSFRVLLCSRYWWYSWCWLLFTKAGPFPSRSCSLFLWGCSALCWPYPLQI
ncbi:HAE1 family hydrophobic/amphiphilic exporter-1 (mainly G- bacteria), partial [Klebsiella pneumoniae]